MDDDDRQYFAELADEIRDWREELLNALMVVGRWIDQNTTPDVSEENELYQAMAKLGYEMIRKVEG